MPHQAPRGTRRRRTARACGTTRTLRRSRGAPAVKSQVELDPCARSPERTRPLDFQSRTGCCVTPIYGARMRARRADGKVRGSRDLTKGRAGDGRARFRGGATPSGAARLDGGASATAAEPRSAPAAPTARVTVEPAVGRCARSGAAVPDDRRDTGASSGAGRCRRAAGGRHAPPLRVLLSRLTSASDSLRSVLPRKIITIGYFRA